MSAPLVPPVCWSVVVPVKRLAGAKSRLRAAVPTDLHPGLVVAMAADTVAAALATPTVRLVVVVADDGATAAAARRLGAMVVPDAPAAGLNAALEYGAERARTVEPRCGVAALAADLPALQPADLTYALAAAARIPRALVPDRTGSGTTLLTARAGCALLPAYGENSRDRHLAGGAVDLIAAWPARALDSLRGDVDTPADLRAAQVLGLGRHTATLLHALAS
jgi:2-phospho-L-lactate guanylyltransferase